MVELEQYVSKKLYNVNLDNLVSFTIYLIQFLKFSNHIFPNIHSIDN